MDSAPRPGQGLGTASQHGGGLVRARAEGGRESPEQRVQTDSGELTDRGSALSVFTS